MSAVRRVAGAAISLVLTTLAVTGSLAPHKPDGPRQVTPIVVATGSPIGVYYQYGEQLAALVAADLGPARVAATAGSVENLRMIEEGTATFAFTTGDAAVDGYLGRGPFAGPVPVRAVARLYDNYLHLVVPADSPVRNPAQLRGLRVAVGPDGSGAALIAGRVLAAAGLDQRTDLVSLPLSLDDAVVAIAQRRIEAFFWSGGLPTAGITELARTMPIRLVDLGGTADHLRERYGSAYRVGRFPAGAYPGIAVAVSTVAAPNYLVTPAGAPERVVHQVTELLFAGAPVFSQRVPQAGRLNRGTAIFTTPIPLHPGALRYYRSREGSRSRS
nr:TAXI family TRAP transporter solute-binding subunit [Planosporangium mesophilum]